MQTILLFGGKSTNPHGGTRDFLGALPFISHDVLVGTVLTVAKKSGPLENWYWANVLILADGASQETRNWKIRVGGGPEAWPKGLKLVYTSKLEDDTIVELYEAEGLNHFSGF